MSLKILIRILNNFLFSELSDSTVDLFALFIHFCAIGYLKCKMIFGYSFIVLSSHFFE